ncbi:outer membrane transport energization protein ExbB [Paucimonas lemoignei]|uniref:Outer membrane transport energization protein ExbB n=1 Tax=Paucimonas lemoignei TaxID=29443 RepID=A0A4R3I5J9_PAULE|nr:MotA/TolQ/ExbB proton channel family protein [Paucimonas lemoignei]TCS39279.1 outer membrane transport energization protein ExbB [Paucimonas lemoignei]
MNNLQATLDSLRYGGLIVYPLLALALLALLICIDKLYVYLRYVRLPAAIVDLVETYDFSWVDLGQRLKALGPRNYFVRFFRVIMENRSKPVWWVESRAGDEAQQLEKSLGRGLWVLETIVTAAPLLGLLGTIDGMMDSFKLIGGSGLVNPAGITGGVAQALIATALGLVIAILALFAFNFFSSRQAQTVDEMERLGTRLTDHIRLDQQAQTARGESREAA